MSDIERETFEGFAVSSLGYFGQDLQRGKYGRYVKPSLQKCWETWQAARQAPASCNNGQDCEHCEPEHGCKALASVKVPGDSQ